MYAVRKVCSCYLYICFIYNLHKSCITYWVDDESSSFFPLLSHIQLDRRNHAGGSVPEFVGKEMRVWNRGVVYDSWCIISLLFCRSFVWETRASNLYWWSVDIQKYSSTTVIYNKISIHTFSKFHWFETEIDQSVICSMEIGYFFILYYENPIHDI